MLSLLMEVAGPLISKFIPDKAQAAKMAAELEQHVLLAEAAARQGQLEINKAEAAHKSLFVAGWRPFIGWVCGLAIAWIFLVQPIALWWVAAFGSGQTLPTIPSDALFELILAMLGMGGLRTFEKVKNIAREK